MLKKTEISYKLLKAVDIVIKIKVNAKKLFKMVSRGNYFNTIQEENLLRTLKEEQNDKN